MLELDRVSIAVDGRPVLHDITLQIESGETHVLFGPNGSGKTSLLMAIMGLPRYQVTSGTIRFQQQDIAGLSIDERARLGIGLLYQRPPTLRGLRLGELADICAGKSQTGFCDRICGATARGLFAPAQRERWIFRRRAEEVGAAAAHAPAAQTRID